jgi:hypothetical protein
VRLQNSFVRAALRQVCAFFLPLYFLLNIGWAGNFDPSIYHSYSSTLTWAHSLADYYPDLVKVVNYGTSSSYGLPLFAIEITSNVKANDQNKADFLFTAGIHAREVIGSESAIAIANTLVEGYLYEDPVIVNALSKRDVWIIPQLNPDGRLQVETGSIPWQRKNWALYPDQGIDDYSRGVDLNRNFPHQWGYNEADHTPWMETYCGPNALSESESISLWNFVQNKNLFSNLTCSVDLHSGDERGMTPWTYSSDPSPALPPAVAAKFNSLKTHLGQITGLDTGPYTIGPVFGALADSLYEKFGSYSMTEELYSGSGDTYSVFNPLNETDRDYVTNKAVASAMYLLSDAAFAVPEPSSVVLLAVAGLAMLACLRRRIR